MGEGYWRDACGEKRGWGGKVGLRFANGTDSSVSIVTEFEVDC